MTMFGIPERAIETFESIHRLNVTVHDFTGKLGPFLKPYRFHHRSAFCLAVKSQGHSSICLNFELKDVRKDLANLPEGRVHLCHAGLIEWVVPVFEKQKLTCILFAGPRRPGKNLVPSFSAQPTRWMKSPFVKGTMLSSAVDENESQRIMEHLRQLGARLQKWIQELHLRSIKDDQPGEVHSESLTTRQAAVFRFVEDRYSQAITLPMLARELRLSDSRASHVVRKCCGTSFRELVIQKRLNVAMDLLRQSGMSVLEVALACGFGDLAHFHRLFRRRIGSTPAQYRIKGRS